MNKTCVAAMAACAVMALSLPSSGNPGNAGNPCSVGNMATAANKSTATTASNPSIAANKSTAATTPATPIATPATPVSHPVSGKEVFECDSLKMTLVRKIQSYCGDTASRDGDVRSPKSVNFHPDGEKFWLTCNFPCLSHRWVP